jgi:hypothetical protein
VEIGINETWNLVRIGRKRESGELSLTFKGKGQPMVQRQINQEDTELLLRIFEEHAVPAGQRFNQSYTTLRKLGLAKPILDASGKMLLTPAGRRVAIWIKSRGHVSRTTRREVAGARQR